MAGSETFYLQHRKIDVGEGDREGGAHSSALDLEPGTVPKGDIIVA